MNENDKILLSSYIDNSLSSDEIKYVEELLKTEPKALDYLNKLKEVDNAATSFFDQALISNEAKEFDSFIESLDIGKKETSAVRELFKNVGINLSGSLKKFINPPVLVGYALTGMLFFSIGLLQSIFFLYVRFQNEFSYDSPLLKTFYVFRGDNSFEKNIEKTLNEMISIGKGNAEITYGANIFTLSIREKILEKGKFECFEGILNNEEKMRDFIFCKSDTETSLILNDA